MSFLGHCGILFANTENGDEAMTVTEQKQGAKQFVKDWTGKGHEKGNSQPFWIDLLSRVMKSILIEHVFTKMFIRKRIWFAEILQMTMLEIVL